jgi:non-ribosomal peptide synthetase component F
LDVSTLYSCTEPTEVTIDSVYYECLKDDISIPIGKPGYNTQAYIVDKYFNPVPVGVHGELLLGGVDVARGYINNEKLTAEKFIDEFSEMTKVSYTRPATLPNTEQMET